MKFQIMPLLLFAFFTFSVQSTSQQTAPLLHRAPGLIVSLHETTNPIEWEQNKDVVFGCREDQPEICTAHIGDIDVSENDGRIRYKENPVEIIYASIIGNSPELPELRYFIPDIYGSVAPEKPNLICIVYGYPSYNPGSGPYNALVMIFVEDDHAAAFRFDGIDSNCHNWRTDGKGRFLYPVKEVTYIPPIEIRRYSLFQRALVWHICTIQGCEHHLDPRPVYEEDEEDGRNKIWHTEPGFPAFEWDKPVGAPWP